MHQVADEPAQHDTMTIQARLTAASGVVTNRLTTQTIAWSTLLLAGNASSSRPNGAPSIGLNHHQPLSIVLLLCIRAKGCRSRTPSGTRKSRRQPSRKTNRHGRNQKRLRQHDQKASERCVGARELTRLPSIAATESGTIVWRYRHPCSYLQVRALPVVGDLRGNSVLVDATRSRI